MTKDFDKTIDLVLKAKEGDDAALNLLMGRYSQRVLRIVRARLDGKLRARLQSMDVVQEVMLKALKGFENFEIRDEAAFLHWISALVRNEIRDLADHHLAAKRNAQKEAQPIMTDDGPRSVLRDIPVESQWGLSKQLGVLEDVVKMEEAMDKLDEKQREIVIMRQYEGLAFKDIGSSLGMKEDAVRMQFARALNRLAKLMSE